MDDKQSSKRNSELKKMRLISKMTAVSLGNTYKKVSLVSILWNIGEKDDEMANLLAEKSLNTWWFMTKCQDFKYVIRTYNKRESQYKHGSAMSLFSRFNIKFYFNFSILLSDRVFTLSEYTSDLNHTKDNNPKD